MAIGIVRNPIGRSMAGDQDGKAKRASGAKRSAGASRANGRRGDAPASKATEAPKPKASAPAKKPAASKKPPARPRGPVKKRSVLGHIVYAGAVLGVWALIAGMIIFAYFAHDLPDLDNLPDPGANDPAVVVKAAGGETLVRSGPLHGDWLMFDEIPDAMVWAILSIEDRYFFDHGGIDGRGLARAAATNIRSGGVRAGGSTITQQLAKNMFLTNQRSFKRKAQEALLAFWLEQRFTKEQILTLYLNRSYFGGGAYGIDAAAHRFFDHGARNLTISEAAMLAGLVQAPSRLAPHINPEGAWDRGKVVLSTMAESGHLPAETARKLMSRPPKVVKDSVGPDVRYFTDWVEAEARRLLPNVGNISITIHTTIDLKLQRAASAAIEEGLAGEGSTVNAGQGALIALGLDGAVRAMVGGRDYRKSQYNRAVQAARQPGSAFKLFTYLAAFERGHSLNEIVSDRPITIGKWSPRNYTNRFDGDIRLRDALAKSTNTVAVRLSQEAGTPYVAALANRMGITTQIAPHPSLALGTEEVKLIDLANAYRTVASGGMAASPYGIVEITELGGRVLYRQPPMSMRQAISYEVAATMTEGLQGVIEYGSGRAAKLDRPAAGKTGTTQDSRDALFVGFTSDLATAVWVGNDSFAPMKDVTGGRLPARIWGTFMKKASEGTPVRPLLADAGLYIASAQSMAADDTNKPAEKEDGWQKTKKSLWERLFGSRD